MGCDIHGYAEWRFPKEQQQYMVLAPIPDVRNYRIFELLANVRPSGDLHSFEDDIPRRGLPDDLAFPDHDGLEYGEHSQTWYTLDELSNMDLWSQVINEPTGALWVTFLSYCKQYAAEYTFGVNLDVRIVIGFDS